MMLANRAAIAVFAAVMLTASSAMAQYEKNEIGGVLGRTIVSDQGINLSITNPTIHTGKGLTVQGEYARRLWVTPIYSLSGEVVAAYNPDIDLNASAFPNPVVPTDLKSFFVTPAARANLFPTTAVSPWVSFGAGFGRFTQGKNLDYGTATQPNPGKANTGAVIQFGLGLDVKVWKRVSIRGGVRDFYSQEPNYPLAPTGKSRQHNFFVGGGAFWRF